MNIAALTLPLVPGSEQIIIPAGTFDAPNGAMRGSGPWTLSDDNGQKIADNLNASAIDIVVDYEHQTIMTAENGKPAPAAGWLLRGGFVWIPDVGLAATAIRWTVEAAEMIKEGEYRYLSPVFSYSEKGVPLSLMSVALTNTPALTQLQELAIASQLKGSYMSSSDVEQTDTAPVASIETATTPVVVTAHPMIAALTNQVAALGSENARLRADMAALQQQLSNSARDGIITAALSDGRLLPAMEKWARSVSIEDLSEYLANAIPIAALTHIQTQGKKPPKAQELESGLSEDDMAVCAQMQIDPKVFISQRTKERAK
jgi:phage I-like protein